MSLAIHVTMSPKVSPAGIAPLAHVVHIRLAHASTLSILTRGRKLQSHSLAARFITTSLRINAFTTAGVVHPEYSLRSMPNTMAKLTPLASKIMERFSTPTPFVHVGRCACSRAPRHVARTKRFDAARQSLKFASQITLGAVRIVTRRRRIFATCRKGMALPRRTGAIAGTGIGGPSRIALPSAIACLNALALSGTMI